MRRVVFPLLAMIGCQSLSQAEVAGNETSETGAPSSSASTGQTTSTPDPADATASPVDSDTTTGLADPDSGSETTGPGVSDDGLDGTTTGGAGPGGGTDTGGEVSTGGSMGGSTGASTGEPSPPQTFPELSCADEPTISSPPGGAQVDVDFFNESGEPRRAYFLNQSGGRELLFEIGDGTSEAGWLTYVGHLWVITDADDQCVTIFEAAEEVGGMTHQITLY